MNYLKNDICKLKPLFEFNPNKKVNIFCSVFFRMKQHYKNVNKYVKGLKEWSKYMKNAKHDYKFRLFIDKNVYEDTEIMKIINSCEKMQPVLFECSEYMTENYHIDLFGTLLRYFPMFNFENNDADKVLVVDIDFGNSNDYKMPRFNTIIDYSKKNEGPVFSTSIEPFLTHFKDKKFEMSHIYSSALLFDKQYDKNILINFIIDAHNIKDVGKYNKRTTPFGFGVDELFLNKYFFNIIEKQNIGLLIYFNPNNFLWFMNEFNLIKNNELTESIYIRILGKLYKKHMNLDEMKELLDNVFYDKFEASNIARYLGKRIFNTLEYLLENKIEWIDFNLIKFILKNYKNIYLSVSILKYNYKRNKFEKSVNGEIKYL